MKHVAGVIIVNSNNEVLLVKRKDSGYWTVPGGKPNDHEPPTLTAVRECMEETGIDLPKYGIEHSRLLPVFFAHAKLHDLGYTHILYYAAKLHGRPESNRPMAHNVEPDKHDDVRWLPLCDTSTDFIVRLRNAREWMNDRDRTALHQVRCLLTNKDNLL